MAKQLRVDPGADCKRRVKLIKKKLPKNIKQKIFQDHKEYDTASGTRLIDNVIAGRSADLKLTEILETIVAKKGGNNA